MHLLYTESRKQAHLCVAGMWNSCLYTVHMLKAYGICSKLLLSTYCI